jgi:hypothetical protein
MTVKKSVPVNDPEPQHIFQKIQRVASLEEEISLYQTEISSLRRSLEKDIFVHLSELPMKKIEEESYRLYWLHPLLAGPARKAFFAILKKPFTPPPKEFEIPCHTCMEGTVSTSFSSWKQLKEARG